MSPGPDMDTLAFSFPYTYSIAHLYVHWALVKDRKVVYHMHRLRLYVIDTMEDGIFRQRCDLNNLLEWMLFERRRWVGVLLADLIRAKSPQLPPSFPLEDGDENPQPDEESISFVGMSLSVALSSCPPQRKANALRKVVNTPSGSGRQLTSEAGSQNPVPVDNNDSK